MAKFTTWPQWADMARDLKRGLYQLTFRDNMPDQPPRVSWAPEYSALGAMTYTQVRTDYAYYFKIGRLYFFAISASGLTGGSASPALAFSLPAKAAAGAGDQLICCLAGDPGLTVTAGFLSFVQNTTTCTVYKADASNWGIGAARRFVANGFYFTD